MRDAARVEKRYLAKINIYGVVLIMELWEEKGMETVEKLIEELMSDNCEIRWRAARALRWTKAARAVRPLIKAMGDRDCNVRWSAAESLVVIGEPAVHPLTDALKDPDRDIRWRAGWALGRLRNTVAVDSLIRTLNDEDPDVRWRAAWALGQIGDARATKALVRALQDNSSNVRWSAIEALGVMKDVDAVGPLIHLLLNPGEETILRAAAADALGTIGNPEAEAALKAIILRDDFAPIHDTARQALERIEKAD